jgi:hypothetical protein
LIQRQPSKADRLLYTTAGAIALGLAFFHGRALAVSIPVPPPRSSISTHTAVEGNASCAAAAHKLPLGSVTSAHSLHHKVVVHSAVEEQTLQERLQYKILQVRLGAAAAAAAVAAPWLLCIPVCDTLQPQSAVTSVMCRWWALVTLSRRHHLDNCVITHVTLMVSQLSHRPTECHTTQRTKWTCDTHMSCHVRHMGCLNVTHVV